MHSIWLLLGRLIVNSILLSCNPVPNPGATGGPVFSPMHVSTQKTLSDFQGFQVIRRQGEGCHAATGMAEADTWMFQWPHCSAKRGNPPPANLGSSLVQPIFSECKSEVSDVHANVQSCMVNPDTKGEFFEFRIFL